MKKGEIYEGNVAEILFPDKGRVVTAEGETATVKYALPGEKISFRVSKKKRDKIDGTLLEVLEPAEYEKAPQCPHYGRCGGCIYQTLEYEKQLEIKEGQIRKILEADNNDIDFEGITASPQCDGYRNKMELTFGDEHIGGELTLGMHKRGSFYDIEPVSDCRLMDLDMRKAAACVLEHFQKLEIPYYHRMRHTGTLRHLLIRRSNFTKELMLAVVTSSQTDGRSIEEYLKLDALLEKLRALQLEGTLSGLLHMLNDSVADTVQSEKTTVIYGKDYITESLLGLKFKITPFSFFQTNSKGAERLYSVVREYIGDIDSRNVFDLYSGTGTIAQLLAPVAKHVTGVEIVEEAVEAAKENAVNNGLDNCSFIAGDVLKVLDELEEKPDIIILDPPRDGVHPKALTKIINYNVPSIVYVSCKPTSFARDRKIFEQAGYSLVKARAVDMFPWTGGIETVCLLSKLNTKQHIEADIHMD